MWRRVTTGGGTPGADRYCGAVGAREANRESRERALLEAAIEAFAELGFSEVRLSDIAKRAGMTAGHLSYYFPSKSELLRRAIEMSEGRLIEDARAALARLERPEDRLRTLIDLSLADRVRDPGWLLWFQVWAGAALHPEITESHHALDGEWRALLRQVIDEGIAAGRFRAEDPDATAAAIAGMLDGLSIQLVLEAPGYGPERIRAIADAAVAALLGA